MGEIDKKRLDIGREKGLTIKGKLLAFVGIVGIIEIIGIVGRGINSFGKETIQSEVSASLSGSLQIVGSSSMEKLSNVLAEGFMEKYPDVNVSVQFTGSSAGVVAVAEGSADVGNSSRELTDREREQGVVDNEVGLDGIAVCVHCANPVVGLKTEQLVGIYTGEFTNWYQLGGGDTPIVVVGREAGSGTRSSFEELLDVAGRCTYGNELDSMGAVLARVAATPGAIGYVSFDAIEDGTDETFVRALSLNGIKPCSETVKSGAYPLYRPLSMVTRGKIEDQNPLVRAWFDYVYSEEGQEAAKKAGVIPLSREGF